MIIWSSICLPKKGGGLGIRKAEHMNKVILTKLGWRLLTEMDKLRSKLMRSKYNIEHLY